MKRYDSLRGTWIYQEIEEEVYQDIRDDLRREVEQAIQQEERQRQHEERQQIVLELVQARFPHLQALARASIAQCTDGGVLHAVIVRLGCLRTEKETRFYLTALAAMKSEAPAVEAIQGET